MNLKFIFFYVGSLFLLEQQLVEGVGCPITKFVVDNVTGIVSKQAGSDYNICSEIWLEYGQGMGEIPLKDIEDNFFSNMSNLQLVYARNNFFTRLKKSWFDPWTIPKFQEIKMDNNLVTSVDDGVFDGMTVTPAIAILSGNNCSVTGTCCWGQSGCLESIVSECVKTNESTNLLQGCSKCKSDFYASKVLSSNSNVCTQCTTPTGCKNSAQECFGSLTELVCTECEGNYTKVEDSKTQCVFGTNNDDQKKNIIIIVCSVVGGVILLAVILAISVYLYRRRQEDLLDGMTPKDFVMANGGDHVVSLQSDEEYNEVNANSQGRDLSGEGEDECVVVSDASLTKFTTNKLKENSNLTTHYENYESSHDVGGDQQQYESFEHALGASVSNGYYNPNDVDDSVISQSYYDTKDVGEKQSPTENPALNYLDHLKDVTYKATGHSDYNTYIKNHYENIGDNNCTDKQQSDDVCDGEDGIDYSKYIDDLKEYDNMAVLKNNKKIK